jgi:hypothetical protein
MKRFYHGLPASSTLIGLHPGNLLTTHLSLSHGDFQGSENEKSYAIELRLGCPENWTAQRQFLRAYYRKANNA